MSTKANKTVVKRGKKMKSSTTISTDIDPTKKGLLTLPPELRNRIYDLVLIPTSGRPIHIRAAQKKRDRGKKVVKKWKRGSWREPSLLKVSKEIRKEALPLYYGCNAFVVSIFMEEIGKASEWVSSVVKQADTAKGVFLALAFVVQREAWGKLEEFRPFLELGMRVGVDFARAKGMDVKVTEANDLQPPVFEMSRNTGPYIREAFAKIVEIGREAHADAGWSEQYLDRVFERVLRKHRATPAGKAAMSAERLKARKAEQHARALEAAEALLAFSGQ